MEIKYYIYKKHATLIEAKKLKIKILLLYC